MTEPGGELAERSRQGDIKAGFYSGTWHVVTHVPTQRPSGGYHVTKVQKLHAESRTVLLTSLKAKLRL